MGKLIGYSILKVDHPVAIMGVFERFNEARRKLEELSKNGGKYRIQEEWIGEPASVINKRREYAKNDSNPDNLWSNPS